MTRPSRYKGEGGHDSPAVCQLSCGHTVLFSPSPFPNDYVMCVRCAAGSHVLTITRQESLAETLSQTA